MRLQDAEPRSSFHCILLKCHNRHNTASEPLGDLRSFSNRISLLIGRFNRKLKILINWVYEFRSITIIAHQRIAKYSIVVKTLFILIASFDCFSLLIVRGGLWHLAHSHCHLCWQASHLFTESLNQILVLRLQKAQQRWREGENYSLLCTHCLYVEQEFFFYVHQQHLISIS